MVWMTYFLILFKKISAHNWLFSSKEKAPSFENVLAREEELLSADSAIVTPEKQPSSRTIFGACIE